MHVISQPSHTRPVPGYPVSVAIFFIFFFFIRILPMFETCKQIHRPTSSMRDSEFLRGGSNFRRARPSFMLSRILKWSMAGFPDGIRWDTGRCLIHDLKKEKKKRKKKIITKNNVRRKGVIEVPERGTRYRKTK